ncbi:MAG: trypsin-like peptidase domain-containing protein [Oscillospiraceae bacterium]|nr:trypsin-like peptidase domain-containing protein [Oscillospiraceae bacterium]
MKKDIIISGVLFLAAAFAAAAAGLIYSAQDKVQEFEFEKITYTCGHTEYTDTLESVENAKKSVVRVLCKGEETELSTAFAVGKSGENAEYFLTAYHGVKDGEIFLYTDYIADALIKDGRILLDYTRQGHRAVLAAYDEKSDIALLKAESPLKNAAPMKILDSGVEIIQGEELYGLCFPVSEDKLLNGDGYEKSLYADSGSVTVLKGESAKIFEGQDELLHLKMELSGGCSGGPVILKNGTAAGMVKQGNFSIIIDPVKERDIYEPAGNGTAVKAHDLAAFLEDNGVPFESGEPYRAEVCSCEASEISDEDSESLRSRLMKQLETAEVIVTLLFGALNVIACAIFINRDETE